MRPPRTSPFRLFRRPGRRLVLAALLAGLLLGIGAVWTNALGVGTKFENLVRKIELAIDPPPDRPTVPTIVVTPPPDPTPTAVPGPTPPAASASPGSSPSVTPPSTPAATPVRAPIDFVMLGDPGSKFASELTKEWCAPAGVQMVLATLGLADTSTAFQTELINRTREFESFSDSHNGSWGPAAMVEALTAYGAQGYEIHAHATREEALGDAAAAVERTGSPAVLLAWRGAHTWVMTGFRADADPLLFPDAVVSGTYILDPWYPRISSIWGPSDPPGTYQDAAEMLRNFLPWKRPEGKYPDRDGRFIIIVPTLTVPGWEELTGTVR